MNCSVTKEEESQNQEKDNDRPVLKRLATLGDLLKEMLPQRSTNEGIA